MINGYRKNKRNIVVYAVIIMALICAIFAVMIRAIRQYTENKSYNELHAEATYIKNDLSIRIRADRKNLANMANFAATLYADGKSYDILFNSFEQIGLVSSIGILNSDNIFISKRGSIDLNGKISFEDEIQKGEYISGRTQDVTIGDKEIVRCAVPIVSNGENVGILYGVIFLNTIADKYTEYVNQLGAQLFVYDKETGKFIVDTVNENPSELSMLIDRKYNNGHKYEDFMTKERGFSSFNSVFRNENINVYFSTIDDINWSIILGRYESQMFKEMHVITDIMLVVFYIILIILIAYFIAIIQNEKIHSRITSVASLTRKLLLEVNQKPQNIEKSLQMIMDASESRSAFFINMHGKNYVYTEEKFNERIISSTDKYFKTELLRYADEFKDKNYANSSVTDIKADSNLLKKNKKLYECLKSHSVEDVVFSSITYNDENNCILGVINPKNKSAAKKLIDEIAVCFSIAIYNKNRMNSTYIEATTDSLTGVFNRAAYERDLSALNEQKSDHTACIYIDVNELHIRNNNYGHAAGDKMLVFIANSLKHIFSDARIYRMGGDEFLTFIRNADKETVKKNIKEFCAELDSENYHVAIGVSYRKQNADIKETVKEAEERMYDSKAQYYHDKGQASVYSDNDINYIRGSVDAREADAILSASQEYFNGILKISFEKDTSYVILAKAYPGRHKANINFSKRFVKYIDEAVHPDFHREVTSFLNYDVLKKRLAEGIVPKIRYKKLNGESIILSVYNINKNSDTVNETLWVFAKG